MAMSGVKINDECVAEFKSMQINKKSDTEKISYLIFHMDEKLGEVVILEKSTTPMGWDDFCSQKMPDDDCRYAVYDYELPGTAEKAGSNKLVFVAWVPDTARVKRKMVYASTKEALKKKIPGFACEVQAADRSELDEGVVLEKFGIKGQNSK